MREGVCREVWRGAYLSENGGLGKNKADERGKSRKESDRKSNTRTKQKKRGDIEKVGSN